jgi:peptide/nickel transport system substrate-binding protein
LIYDTRYGLDEQYRPQPPMVERREAGADGLQWTLALREDLKFHDHQLNPGQK